MKRETQREGETEGKRPRKELSRVCTVAVMDQKKSEVEYEDEAKEKRKQKRRRRRREG